MSAPGAMAQNRAVSLGKGTQSAAAAERMAPVGRGMPGPGGMEGPGPNGGAPKGFGSLTVNVGFEQ